MRKSFIKTFLKSKSCLFYENGLYILKVYAYFLYSYITADSIIENVFLSQLISAKTPYGRQILGAV